ncbi:MAG: hypothetical protein CMK59_05815 [Proteobacteria bacterium]|nr:hypothetical protein [Pseudomonadota bacterium]
MFAILAILSIQNVEAVPLQVTQQGRIIDSDGAAVVGTHNVTYRLYNASTGGSVLWTEILVTNFNNGYYAAVLGADEENNPLDSDTLSLYPLYLELQLNNNAPMTPRHALNSTPYAQMAGLAQSVDGGSVNASEISVANALVIDGGGNWVGEPITVDWTSINNIPSEFLDGDNDTQLSESQVESYITNDAVDFAAGSTLAGDGILTQSANTLDDLSCAAGEIVGWNGTVWTCLSDSSLDEQAVEQFVTNDSIDLAANSTVDGSLIETEATDDDTLADLSCSAGQVAVWDGVIWTCDDQPDTTVPLVEPGPCDSSTVGQMYYDLATETLRLCDGSDWKKLKTCDEVCPSVDDVACGEDVYDDCGDSCGSQGTAFNGDQCAAAEDATCGGAVYDDCGNDCGYLGEQCLSGVCNNGTCCGDNTLEGDEECDDGNNVNSDGCNEDCTLPPSGNSEYTEPGTYSFTVPEGVFEVVALAIGAGGSGNRSGGGSAGGGGGGAKSFASVTPGQVITFTVGRGGGNSGVVQLDGGESSVGAPFSITAGGGFSNGDGGVGTGGNLHNSQGGSAASPNGQKISGDASETGDAGGAGAWLNGFGYTGLPGNGLGYGGGGGGQNCVNYGGSCAGGSGGVNGYSGGSAGSNGDGPNGGSTGVNSGTGCAGTYINGGGGGSFGGGGGNDGSGQGDNSSCALDLFLGGDGGDGYVRFEWGG